MKGLAGARLSLLLLAAILLPAVALAQTPPLTLPQSSPEATVTQRIGLTDITISYHRPAVNKRTVWGDLVPYDQVWRAGANENTTVTFSSPVNIEGRPLAAGTYGLHMIPTKSAWTVIFSKTSSAWGSFSYDEKEDAARATVTPVEAPFQERLGYSFDDPTDKSVTMVLRWEKLAVPIKVEVDTPAVVVEHLRGELRGLARFNWQGWNTAANYCLQNDVNLDEAIAWADRSIQMNENFTNLQTRAGLAQKKGDAAMAANLRTKSISIATEVDINAYGYQLLGQKKTDEAIAMFQKNVKDHPQSWNTYDSLGEAYDIKGEKKLAADNYKKALSMVKDEDNKKRINGILKRLGATG